MKKKRIAMLLAMVLLLGTCIPGAWAQEAAHLELSSAYKGETAVVTIALSNAAGVKNGILETEYDPEDLQLLSARASEAVAVSSINSKTAGTVSMAWVGSDLKAEKTLMLTLEFAVLSEQGAKVTAKVEDAALSVEPGSVTIPAYNPFVDIEGHWAKEQILESYHAGLFRGMTATTFAPEREINRAMFVTVLYRLEGSPAVDLSKLSFTDVPDNAYCTAAIVWAVEQGVTKGTGNNCFEPMRSITRQEIVTMLHRYASTKGEVSSAGDLSSFQDQDEISSWAKTSMQWAVAEGLVKGYTDRTIRPNAYATRAQAAALLCRFAFQD